MRLYLQLVQFVALRLQLPTDLAQFSVQQLQLLFQLFGFLVAVGHGNRLKVFQAHALFAEHGSEPPIFFLKVEDALPELCFFVPIDDGGVFDVHGFAGVFERVQTFFVIAFGRRNTGDHVGIGVATQTVLQNSSEL